jgi:hypothetical protein
VAVDDRRELNAIFRHYDRFTRGMGEQVEWFELDKTNSTTHAVYDESPNKVYYAPHRVTVVGIDQTEMPAEQSQEGRHTTNMIHFGVTAQALREAGVTNVHGQAQQHLNDVVAWDGRFFAVTSYQVRGRVRADVVIGVTAVEVMEFEEYVFDTNPPTVPPYEPVVND